MRRRIIAGGALTFAPGVTPDAAQTDPDGEYDLLFLP